MKNFILLITILFSQFLFAQNLKLPQLNPILNSQLASNDLTIASDISANESKKLSIGELDKRWQWTATTPLLKTGSESAVLSIPLATASAAGYLSSGDWTTFNAKVGTSTTDVLTNKDIDGGTASNTRRITLPKDTKTNLDALTRKQGTIVYDTTSNKPYYDNGTILTAVGSGSGGSKNYIAGGDAESGTTGFATYADAAGTSPVDGTGGSPSVTWATSATTPLESLNSFLLTKGATNRQGDGASYAFTIDRQDQAKVLQISFNYLVDSGTFVAGSPGVASDVTVWIYDVTNAVLIQPSSINLLSNSTTIADKFNATFQTASNSTSYRLIFHVRSTSAAAYTLKIDTIVVSPSAYVYGTPITDWVAWAPTGSWSTNTTYTGLKRRVGDAYEYQVKIATSGAPTSAALTINVAETIDTAKLIQGGAAFEWVGGGAANDSGTAYVAYVAGSSSNSVQVRYQSATSGASSQITQAAPFTFGASDYVTVNFTVPILGQSSSVQMSDQTDTRIVSLLAQSNSTQALTANTTDVAFQVVVKDSHASFTSPSYRVAVAGDHLINVGAKTSASAGQLVVYVNGSSYIVLSGVSTTFSGGSVLIPNLKVGDLITIRCDTSLTLASGNTLSISRISGPSAIAATESYNFRYTSSAGTGLTSGTNTLTFGTKDYDSHGSFNGTTFTPQIGGKFDCEVKIAINTISGLSTNYLRILVAGSTVSEKALAFSYSTASPFTFDLPDTINVLAGQAVTFQFQNGFGSTVNMDSTAARNSVACKRVGN